MFQLFYSYIIWHYSRAYAELLENFKNLILFLIDFFNIRLFFRTLSGFVAESNTYSKKKPFNFFLPRAYKTFSGFVNVVVSVCILSIGLVVILLTLLSFAFVLLLWAFVPFLIVYFFIIGLRLIINSHI